MMNSDLGMNVGFLLLMFVVMYFIILRPQMKKQKEQKSMVSSLAKGDEVVVSGIVGKISEIDNNYLRLEIAKGVYIQAQRSLVSTLLPKGTIQLK
jgi:preprotein translocase subunit YajC